MHIPMYRENTCQLQNMNRSSNYFNCFANYANAKFWKTIKKLIYTSFLKR